MKGMKLEALHVEDAKVRDYLLSSSHPIGRFKARFFRSLGFTEENWPELKTSLLRLGREGMVTGPLPSDHGSKYLVSDSLTGPNGRSATVLTVWIVPEHSKTARLVTAMPGDRT